MRIKTRIHARGLVPEEAAFSKKKRSGSTTFGFPRENRAEPSVGRIYGNAQIGYHRLRFMKLYLATLLHDSTCISTETLRVTSPSTVAFTKIRDHLE